MSGPKNLAASVNNRLLALAKERGESFHDLLIRYGIERFLYRLSRSPHADRFLLKGAMLFVIWDNRVPRPTRDLDLLAFGSTDRDEILCVFREVIGTEVSGDGLAFDESSLVAEQIREDQIYGGLRVKLLARLGAARIPLQIDLGTGDAVTPEPVTAEFPALLNFPAPSLWTYPIYTVVAEKFEAMVTRGWLNTRMKDFYDLRYLSRRFAFDGPLLHEAIRATFFRRQTELAALPYPFTSAFLTAPEKAAQWSSFLDRNGLSGAMPNFSDVMIELREFIQPALGTPPRQWSPQSGWQR
jgi:predicted nucleotidyltransferase component of viral defense system